MKTNQNNPILRRWLALGAVLLNIFFNYYTNINPLNGQTIGEVSGKYPTLFTPAGYAFSIWGVIYLSFIVYIIYQLLPSQCSKAIYDHLSTPLITTSLLSIGWLISFSYERIGLSVILIVSMLITAIILFSRSKQAVLQQQAKAWLSIPFGLYAGWLSVATIVNISVWLKDSGWLGGAWGETTWTIIMLGIALLLSILISFRFRELVYPLVVAWATIGIWNARQGENSIVANFALITGIIVAIWAIGYQIWRSYKHSLPITDAVS